jgi:hypothetical protein
MICIVLEPRYLEVNAAAEQRVADARKQKLCVACMEPLGSDVPIRGCHCKCHRATLRAIERGDTTEIQRVLEGKFLPKKKGGRKPSNPVTQDVTF